MATALRRKSASQKKWLFLAIHTIHRKRAIRVLFSHMEKLVMNCDVLLHEATVGPILSDINRDYLDRPETEWNAIQSQIDQDPALSAKWNRTAARAPGIGHSTIKQAAQFAKKVNAKKLCMLHIGGRYQAKSEEHKRAISKMMQFEAGRYFEGNVEVCEDGMIISISCVCGDKDDAGE